MKSRFFNAPQFSQFLRSQQYLVCLFFILTGCDMTTANRERRNMDELGEYLVLPPEIESTVFEFVTLPENNDSFPPGPTDYAALVARISFKTTDAMNNSLSSLGSTEAKPYPTIFIRKWMTKNEQNSLKKIISMAGKNKAVDVTSWSKKKPIYAAAIPVGDAAVAIFICYVEP